MTKVNRNKSLVSVVMIFLNAGTYIREAIESIRAQTYDQWELWLVDDGSTDDGTAIAREYASRFPDQVHYLEHEGHANRGMSASRNLGIRHARGEHIAFLDSDDVWMPRKLEEQVAILQAHPTAAMVYGRTLIWHSWTGKPEDQQRDFFYTLGVRPNQLVQPPRLLIQLLENKAQTPTTCNVIIRRRVFEEMGAFEDSFRTVHEDQAFYTKVYHRAPVYVANACWAKYRQHPSSSSATAQQKGLRRAARLKYLEWVGRYLTQQGVKDANVWKAFNAELRKYRHPWVERVRQGSRNLKPAAKQHLKTIVRKALSHQIRGRLRSVSRRKRVPAPGALILMYHRVIELDSDPYALCVTPRHFEEHLQVLRKWGQILSLSQLVQGLREGQLPQRGTVLTFDDAYLDNLQIAKPLLERCEAPATMFATSGAFPMKREFWWDELDRLLLRPGTLPSSLTVTLDGREQSWQLGEASNYSESESRRRCWNVYEDKNQLTPRQGFFVQMQQFTYHLSPRNKNAFLRQLADWSGAGDCVRPDRCTVTAEELVELGRGELVEIGAHTVTHPVLPSLLLDEQYSELYDSKTQLEQILGRPITSIAFPHGEFSEDTLIAACEAGYESACAIGPNLVQRGADCIRLPRMKVEDWDGDQFARNVEARMAAA